uniref:Obtusifoliol 14-alpha demethylase n=1 Tax=Leersia perrieri TaxID=77586 RepID=A0A0D9X6A4_9ORYZ
MDPPTSGGSAAVMWLAAAAALLLTIAVLKALRKRDDTSNKHAQGKPAGMAPAPPVLHRVALARFALAVARNGPLEAFRKQQAKLGSVFTARLLGGLFEVTFLVGPEVSHHFYMGPESDINPGNIYDFTVPMLGPEVGYAVDLATRGDQKRFYWDVLKTSSIKASMPAMIEEVEAYFLRWGEEGTVDFKHEMEELLILIVSRCLLGREVRERMLGEVRTLFRHLEDGLGLISILFPNLPTAAHRRRDSAHMRLREIFTEVIKSRRNSGRVGSDETDDVLQRLINSKHRDGRSVSDVEVVGLLLSLVFAGKHTSSSTTIWTGVHLLSNPNYLTACVNEQDLLLPTHNGANHHQIDYDVVQKMSTLHCCVKEALRLHPPVPSLVRQAHKPFTVQTKEGIEYTVPKGHTVMSTILMNHHLPHVYKDPYIYDPLRFMAGREEDKVAGPLSFLSFSAGRHSCMGEAFAYTQIKVIWSYLLRNFDLKMESPVPGINWSTVVPMPKGKVMVSYRKRQLID